jgi:HlyD family secretion protein
MAKAAYKEAMKKYNEYSHKNLTNPDRARALSELVSARDKMNTALAKYNWYLLGYSENEIDQADAGVAVAIANLTAAQSRWESLKDGVSEAAIALAEAQLEQAQSAWEDVKDGPSEEEITKAQAAIDIAQATLDRAQLTTPFSGTITEVGVKTGDLVNSGETAFRIDDLASLYVDLQVSEIDLADLQVGQKATLEFDAIPDKTYNGEVTEIGMIGNVSQGVVNYPVTVKVTDPDADIRPGMTAAVSIILDQREGALLVPNKAIRTSAGQQTVTVLYEGQQISVPVTVGLVGDSMSEILSDQLRAGDVVVLNGSTSSATSTNQQFQRGFEGGGFVIEGGPLPGMP